MLPEAIDVEEESVDSPVFDDAILGLSLGVSARLQMKSPANATTVSLVLAPRSVYILSGSARWEWRHRVAPISSGIRYSLTFRTLSRR